jgi:hypothetical protein
MPVREGCRPRHSSLRSEWKASCSLSDTASGPMLRRCSPSPKPRLRRSVLHSNKAASWPRRSSCAGCSPASRTTRTRGSAPEPSPAGNCYRPDRPCARVSCRAGERGALGCLGLPQKPSSTTALSARLSPRKRAAKRDAKWAAKRAADRASRTFPYAAPPQRLAPPVKQPSLPKLPARRDGEAEGEELLSGRHTGIVGLLT